MSEIRHDFWDDIFERQLYESINTHILSTLIRKVENFRKDFSNILNEFKKIKEQNDKNSKTAIEQIKKEDTLEEVLDIMTSTISDIQQNTGDNVKSEESGFSKFLDELIKEVLEGIKKMDLSNQEMMDMPRKVEVETQIDIKYDQFLEIMYQDEVRRIIGQLNDHGKRYFSIVMDEKKNLKDYVWLAIKEEYFIHRLQLIDIFLTLEEVVLTLKLKKEHFTTNMKARVEMPNISSKINDELSRLTRDNIYLFFIQKTHREEINRIFNQLRSYRKKYNMPTEKAEIITHKNFIMQKIEKIKETLDLKKEVMAFNLQIEEEATNMSNKSENVKSLLMKRNEYLQNFVMMHQNEINRIYAELILYCHSYNKEKISSKVSRFSNVKTDCAERTNMPRETDGKSALRRNIEALQVVGTKFQKMFIDMYNKLQMDRSSYDMPNYNVKIDMKPESYDRPTEIHDDENVLIKEHEYLAFIAIMHLEKIKEIYALFETYLNRFNDSIENITGCNEFTNQVTFVSHEIFVLEGEVSLLNHELLLLKYC